MTTRIDRATGHWENGCKCFQLRTEFAPAGGTISAGECVYIAVPKPFLLGTTLIESAKQLAEMIDEAQM